MTTKGNRNVDRDGPWVGSWRPHRPRGPINATIGMPGPKYALLGLTGADNHDPTHLKAPMYSFGSRPRAGQQFNLPGPAAYALPPVLGSRCVATPTAPSYSIKGRLEPKKKGRAAYQGPGPAAYNVVPPSVYQSRPPGFIMTGRHYPGEKKQISQTPGPAAYRVVDPCVYSSRPPGFIMAGRNFMPGEGTRSLTPGPAAYNVVDPCLYKSRPPGFVMTGRRNYGQKDINRTPGPGCYYPEKVTTTTSQAPSFTFGVRHSDYIMPVTENVKKNKKRR